MRRFNYFLFHVCLLLGAHPAIGASYSMANLGTLGGQNTVVNSLNVSGQATGYSQDSTGTNQAFVYSSNQINQVNIGGTGIGRNINASGQIEGNFSNAHLFVWSNGQTVDLGIPLSGTTCKGYGFNNSGEITGQVTLPSGQVHGFLYNPANGGSTTDIGTLGGHSTDFSYGSSVNASGQIEGDSINSAGLDHAFIWTNGQFNDLGTLGGPDSSGIAINFLGHATGTAQLPGSGETQATYISHVFLYNGSIHDCGTLGGMYANAGAMNNLDQIVGYSYLADNSTRDAFLYSNGVMTDLNSLVPSGSGWTLTAATGINDSGEIVANGVNSQGVTNAFLLTPNVPEPRCIAIFTLAGAALLQRRMIRSRRRRPVMIRHPVQSYLRLRGE